MALNDCLTQFLAQWIRRGDCVFDVGANQGAYAFSMLERVGPFGSVHAFEPNPEWASHLRARGAGLPLTVVEQGVSDHDGVAEFYLDTRSACGAVASSLEKLDQMHATENVRATTISLTSLDAYCGAHGLSPRLIKIDVEGHERFVFRGAVETINRCRPFLVFEFWETWWDRGVSQIFDFLKNDYALIRIQDGQMVNDWYATNRRGGSVDIGCIPIWRGSMNPLIPELLDSSPRSLAAACA